jgi:hypothetical protein
MTYPATGILMISSESLAAAVAEGVITAEQVAKIDAIEARRRDERPEPEDEEKLRFISGFGDIFVTIGLGLFLSAATYFLSQSGGQVVAAFGLALLSWGLTEYFTRIRRMAFPSIVLLVVFASAVFYGSLVGSLLSMGLPINGGSMFRDESPLFAAAAGLITLALVSLHYRRFKVPITVAVGAAAAAAIFYGLTAQVMIRFEPKSWFPTLTFLLGASILALAMRYDVSDPRRLTRNTDIAFWLHMLAAPMIVHPLVYDLARVSLTLSGAMAILLVFLVLGCIAVVIDRRALLVSGLVYAGSAFATLLQHSGINATGATTILVLGAFILLLSAGWQPLRASLLRVIPAKLAERLPSPHHAGV